MYTISTIDDVHRGFRRWYGVQCTYTRLQQLWHRLNIDSDSKSGVGQRRQFDNSQLATGDRRKGCPVAVASHLAIRSRDRTTHLGRRFRDTDISLRVTLLPGGVAGRAANNLGHPDCDRLSRLGYSISLPTTVGLL